MELIDNFLFTVKNKIFASNTYLLKSSEGNECLIIDPGLDTLIITDKINELNLIPVAILSTHGHFDHIGSASYFKKKFNIPFYLHEADYKISQSVNFFMKFTRINLKIDTPQPDVYFKGIHEAITINDFCLDIYNFPGHSNGSCVIKYQNLLFSGDILYKTGIGLDSMPKENKSLLRQSILNIFDMFNDEDLILPGHGPFEYLGVIKKNNSDLRQFLLKNMDLNA